MKQQWDTANNRELLIDYHITDYAMMRPFACKKIVLEEKGKQNHHQHDTTSESEIWSTDDEAIPMNRSIRLEVRKIRKIRSEWREYLFGDKTISNVIFYDKDGGILGKMSSHHKHLVLPTSYITREHIVEDSLKPEEAIVGIQYGMIVDCDEPASQFDRFRFLIVNNF